MFGRSRSLSLRGFSVSLLVDPFRLDFAVGFGEFTCF